MSPYKPDQELPYGVLVGRDFERTEDGDVIYNNGLPVISQDQVVLGDIAPDWTGGANFTLGYKNFSISALFDAKMGGDIHSMTVHTPGDVMQVPSKNH